MKRKSNEIITNLLPSTNQNDVNGATYSTVNNKDVYAYLNKIYDTAAYTCKLCLQNYIWDGIKRDRLVWVGDMHPEMLTVRTVFGNIPLMAQTLEFIKNATPPPEWEEKVKSLAAPFISLPKSSSTPASSPSP